MPSGVAAGPQGASIDPELRRLADQVNEVFVLLNRGIKNIRIYRHAETRYGEFLEPAYKALSAFLEQEALLPLKLGPYTLEYRQQVIYEDQANENLTYRFFRDGVRFLVFRRGLSLDELLRFVLLTTTDVSEIARFQEDWVTRLWKEEFRFIEYVVIEGFALGQLSESEVELEVDKIVGFLRSRMRATTEDFTRFARLSPEDLELELSNIDQIRGGIISGRTASPEEKTKIQEDLDLEERRRLFAKTVLILFQILELDASRDDFDLMLDSFTQVLDSLLVSEDIKGAVALSQRFEAVRAKRLGAEQAIFVQRIAAAFRRRMVESQRLDAIGQYLALSNRLDEDAVRAYLLLASDEDVIKLTDMLATMERSAARRILVEVLSTVGRNHCEVFARRLSSNASQVVRDMLSIIHRIDPPDRASLFARCLEHPNLMVRLEGLKILARTPEPEALRYIEKTLADAEMQVRIAAYRALAVRDPERACSALMRLMQSSDYSGLDQRERSAIASALGETRTRAAFTFLTGLLEQRSGLFSRARVNEAKMMALVGLQSFGTIEVFHRLAGEVQNAAHSKDIMQLAQTAALRVKARLEKLATQAGSTGRSSAEGQWSGDDADGDGSADVPGDVPGDAAGDVSSDVPSDG